MLIGKYSSSAHELLLPFLSVPTGAGPRRPRAGVAICGTSFELLACPPLSRTSTASAVVSSPSGTFRARGNARRRSASPRHSAVGCRCAPRPGARPAGSGTTSRPAPRSPATTRSNSRFAARCRHPTQVRTGPWCSVDMLDTGLRVVAVANRRHSLALVGCGFDLAGGGGLMSARAVGALRGAYPPCLGTTLVRFPLTLTSRCGVAEARDSAGYTLPRRPKLRTARRSRSPRLLSWGPVFPRRSGCRCASR